VLCIPLLHCSNLLVKVGVLKNFFTVSTFTKHVFSLKQVQTPPRTLLCTRTPHVTSAAQCMKIFKIRALARRWPSTMLISISSVSKDCGTRVHWRRGERKAYAPPVVRYLRKKWGRGEREKVEVFQQERVWTKRGRVMDGGPHLFWFVPRMGLLSREERRKYYS